MKLFKRTVTLLITIIILVWVGIYFLVFFSPQSNKVDDYELKKISALLNEHNIKCAKSLIPKNYPELPEISVYNAVHSKLDFSEKILGQNFIVNNSKSYSNEKYLLNFNNNTFSISFTDGNLLKKDFSKADTKKYDELIKKGLSMLGFDASQALISVKSKENSATVLKTINNFPVFDCGFNVSFSNKGISKIEGSWFYVNSNLTYKKSRSLVSVFHEICENSAISGKTITDITPGYKINLSSEYQKEATAHPVWRVTFEDKTTHDYNM